LFPMEGAGAETGMIAAQAPRNRKNAGIVSSKKSNKWPAGTDALWVRLRCMVDTVAKNSNRGEGAVRGRPYRAPEGAGLPRNRRASRTLAPAGDESKPHRRSPWCRPNDRNQSSPLDQVRYVALIKPCRFFQDFHQHPDAIHAIPFPAAHLGYDRQGFQFLNGAIHRREYHSHFPGRHPDRLKRIRGKTLQKERRGL